MSSLGALLPYMGQKRQFQEEKCTIDLESLPGDLQCAPDKPAFVCLFFSPYLEDVNVKLPHILINHVLRELQPVARLLSVVVS